MHTQNCCHVFFCGVSFKRGTTAYFCATQMERKRNSSVRLLFIERSFQNISMYKMPQCKSLNQGSKSQGPHPGAKQGCALLLSTCNIASPQIQA